MISPPLTKSFQTDEGVGGLGASDEAEHVHSPRRHDRSASGAPAAGQEVDHARRQRRCETERQPLVAGCDLDGREWSENGFLPNYSSFLFLKKTIEKITYASAVNMCARPPMLGSFITTTLPISSEGISMAYICAE